MPRLPRPHRPLPPLRPEHRHRLARGSLLFRAYRAGGVYPSAWNTFRTYGPTSARFDPHLPPPHEQERGVLYAAGSLPTALVEAFGMTRVIERSRDEPWLVSFALAAPLVLLDLTGAWPTLAGASQAISSGRRDIARLWAQAIYEDYDGIHGILYPSSMSGPRRGRHDPPLHGLSLALFERAAIGLPDHPTMHLQLGHPGLDAMLGQIAAAHGYDLVR